MASLSLQELKSIKPEDLYLGYPPNQDKFWKPRLTWLLDNYPKETWKMFQRNKKKLKNQVLRVVQRANILMQILEREKNISQKEARALVMEDLVCPANGPALDPNPPEELPDQKRLQVLAWSENLR